MPRTTTLGCRSTRAAIPVSTIYTISFESTRTKGLWDKSLSTSAKRVQVMAEKHGCLGLLVYHGPSGELVKISGTSMAVVACLSDYCKTYEGGSMATFNEVLGKAVSTDLRKAVGA